jgi:transcriptional regulator with XRE-family HTH domain
MNDLLKEKAMCWKTRLKECMDSGKYTQASLAEAMNAKYGTAYGQKDVSRWLNTGAKIKNGEVGFPRYDTMVMIADLLNVDIGFLTGETDEESFTLEKAAAFVGLKGEALQAIRKMTNPESDSILWLGKREALNKVFTADGFAGFTISLSDLNQTYMEPHVEKRIFENLDTAIDYMRNLEYQGKINRYELNEALMLLINEIYPNPPKFELNIKDEDPIRPVGWEKD